MDTKLEPINPESGDGSAVVGRGMQDTDLPLPEFLSRQLKQEILIGDLLPGQLLRQEVLAKRFKVSRVPLREAMSRLEAEGFVELRPRRGYAVLSLEQRDIVEIFELRAVVEAHAGAVAARTHSPAEMREIEGICDRMKSLDRQDSNYLDEWSRLNYAFHTRLISSTHRTCVTRIAGTLRDNVEPYIRMELRLTGQVEDADSEHQEIVEALRAGDAVGLANLCRAHVEHTAVRLLRGLRRSTLSSRIEHRLLEIGDNTNRPNS